MSDFISYMRASAEKRAALERYNAASASLTNAQVMERLAEIKSQHEPLASIAALSLSDRDKLYAAAFYVAVGRLPEDFISAKEKDHG